VNFSKKILQRWIVFPVLFLLLFSCQKERVNNNNPYLANYSFSIQVNMSLPIYNNLQFTGNSIKVDEFGVGNRGIIIYNSGTGFYAFDGACPNQALSSCSTLELSGATATCPCDDAVYSLLDGRSPGLQYPLKQYRAELSGNTVIVSN
jgi:nitrite reductase/ring-hydroxylating ferredoxin subunit